MATPEGKIQLEILKHLRLKGVMCWRAQPHTYNSKLGIHISSPYAMPGQPDIIAILPGGIFCGIEVKTKTGRQNPDQILFQRRAETLGAVYIVARSTADIKGIMGCG
jgi:hypothetical protein